MSEKKGPDGETPGKEPVHVGNIFWRLLQCCLICAVIALTYRHFVLERENMELSERFLIIEGENVRMSKMWLDLDKKIQTLWNEEDHHAYDVSVQERKMNGLDEEKRAKRDTQERKETGKLPSYLPKYIEKSACSFQNVIAVHVKASMDEHLGEYEIEGGVNNIVTQWQPLCYPQDGFTLEEGSLRVIRAGLYFIYSQVLYLEADIRRKYATTYSVKVDEGNFLTCVNNMIGSPPWHTCYTAGVISLEANSIVEISIECEGCSISLSGDSTFFGAILLKEHTFASPMKYGFMDEYG